MVRAGRGLIAPRLDSAGAAPETARSETRRGAADAAAIVVAKDAQPSPSAAPLDLTGKIVVLGERLATSRRLAHDALVREALTRTELTLALNQALIGRAEALAARQAVALQHHLRGQRGAKPRRRNRLSRMVDGLLMRLGARGQAQVVARAAPPQALFDRDWYFAAYPDLAGLRVAPLAHYLTAGGDEGRSPHPLFDDAWYRRRHGAEMGATGLTALEHYARHGAARADAPHPLFDIGWYLGQGPDLGRDEDPVVHYLRVGWSEGLSPHPLFDPAWYAAQMPPESAGVPGLVHYLTAGWKQGLTPHPLFDPAWCLEQYPDLAAAGVEPLTYFVTDGAEQGRDPGPWFDTRRYVAARGEGRLAGRNPLVDYLQGGAWIVAEAQPGFPTAAYLAAWPELAREGMTPLEHWARNAASGGTADSQGL